MERRLIPIAALALIMVACSPGGADGTTTSTVAGTTTLVEDPGAGTTTLAIHEDDDHLEANALCRTLGLLASAGVRPSVAAASIADVDMHAMTTAQMAQYSRELTSATISTCPELGDFATEVVYWLGF